MALPTDTTPFDLPPSAAPDTTAGDDTASVADPSEQNPLGIMVAAAAAGPQTDLTVLDLGDLLQLRLDDDGPTSGRNGAGADGGGERPGDPNGGLAQLLSTADLPADLTSLDLEQVLDLDVSGTTLPTVLEVAQLPADLTAVELAQLLGLKVTGTSAPTIKEVIQLAVHNFSAPKSGYEDTTGDTPAAAQHGSPSHGPAADGPSSAGETISFRAEVNLNAQAHATTHAAEHVAKQFGVLDGASGQAILHGNHFGTDQLLKSSFFDQLHANAGPVGNGNDGGGGGGGGTNVINGTNGADVLTGTAGSDLINGKNGDDTIDGGAGDDKLHGQNGNDTLIWDAADSQVMGGSGNDTLQVTNGDNVDLTTFGGVISGIENVDLANDPGANTLTLTAQDVLNISDTNTVTVTGTAADTVSAGAGWVDGGVAGGYHTYTQVVGPDTATLVVDQTITLV